MTRTSFLCHIFQFLKVRLILRFLSQAFPNKKQGSVKLSLSFRFCLTEQINEKFVFINLVFYDELETDNFFKFFLSMFRWRSFIPFTFKSLSYQDEDCFCQNEIFVIWQICRSIVIVVIVILYIYNNMGEWTLHRNPLFPQQTLLSDSLEN